MAETLYRGILLPERPALCDVRSVLPDYRAMLLAVMAAIADRYDRAPGHPFIDTKLDLITGEDFPPDDPVRGPNAVYGWIQGRGLESLAGHCRWMRRHNLAPELRQPPGADHGRGTRRCCLKSGPRNAGRLSFFMTPAWRPVYAGRGWRNPGAEAHGGIELRVQRPLQRQGHGCRGEIPRDGGCRSGSHGLLPPRRRRDKRGPFRTTDQISLDPDEPHGTPARAATPHGAYMIQIGAAALLAEHRIPDSVEMGLRLIRHEMQTYVNLGGRVPRLREYDFWEAVDDDGRPFEEDGKILSDPGHVLEFIGLTLKFTSAVKRIRAGGYRRQLAEIAGVEAHMPALLAHTFAGGFQTGPRRHLQDVRSGFPRTRQYRHAVVEPS